MKTQNKIFRKLPVFFLLFVDAGNLLPAIAEGSELRKIQAESSLKKAHSRISETQALQIVSDRPEVKKWLRLLKESSKNASAHIALDRKEGHDFVVQVFEEVSDGGGDTHTATVNWYHINDLSGKVKTEF